jgi:hypothetical protein
MTLTEFRDLLLTADPKAKRYMSLESGNFTVWSEYHERYVNADDRIRGKIVNVQVDRYTRDEHDPVVELITQALDEGGAAVIDRRTLFEVDSGYIHHIWDVRLEQL